MILQKWIATEIVKDLIRLDAADSTIALLELEIENYVQQLELKDRVILGHQQQIENLNEIILGHAEITQTTNEELEMWKKKSKKQKRQKVFLLVGGSALVVLALVAN